jgi:hypothetical protein
MLLQSMGHEAWLMDLLNSACCCAGSKFTSGALYDDAQRDAAAAAEAKRLQDLRNNEELPLVYLRVAIQGKPIGQIHFVLFTKESPRAGVWVGRTPLCHLCH